VGILTDPRSLKPSLGREGWCQRLLTELILEGPYPPYNSRRRPAPRGLAFLGALDRLSFGSDDISPGDPTFVDEIDFPARHADEKGCAPDYTVFTEGRCWVIELKTEPASHRPRQVPDYFERARHYHPEMRIDLTYLTAGLRAPFRPDLEDWARYAHLEWSDVLGLITATWSDAEEPSIRDAMTALVTGITHLNEPTQEWWSTLGYSQRPTLVVDRSDMPPVAVPVSAPIDNAEPTEVTYEAMQLALRTANDGVQRALGLEAGGLEALHELRLQVRRACQAAPADAALHAVQPWLWSESTSGGKAKTTIGSRVGYELRLSRTKAT
jgi:hypothetical protein